MKDDRFAFLGDHSLSGVYLLHIRLEAGISISVGRFNGGEPIAFPAGDYLYLGSARNKTLAARLLRHLRRSGVLPAQHLHRAFKQALLDHGFPLAKRKTASKRLHWHIDYLLDSLQTEVAHVLVVRTEERLEAELGRWLAAQPETEIIIEGLGASDVRGSTHLLRLADQAGALDQVMNHFIDRVESRIS